MWLKFYILPKIRTEKKLFGREALIRLNSAKKSCSVCEIKTPEGSRVVEKIYNFSKKLESGIEKAIKGSLEKNIYKIQNRHG